MKRKHKILLARIVAAALMTAAIYFIPVNGVLRFLLFMLPYLTVGYDILLRAAHGIVSGELFDENFLMAVATIGAIAIALMGRGDYTEAVAVMLFFQTGELFQSCAVDKSRRNIGELLSIKPDFAKLESEGEVVTVAPESVSVGSVIVVYAGDKVPIDGIVIEGSSDVDASALTGESMPVTVGVGNEVKSGCVNLLSTLKIRTTKLYADSTVAKILELIEGASSKKSRSEAFITKFSRVYTPAVCACALLLAFVPPLVCLMCGYTADFGMWVYRALTFLVISCPCALVISIPLTFFSALGGASRNGILIKGSDYLETLASVDTVVLDKTGTLTSGEFSVKRVISEKMGDAELLELAATLESESNHPIAKSVVKAHGGKIAADRVKNFKMVAGSGVCGEIDGKSVFVGKTETAERSDTPSSLSVIVDGKCVGQIVIEDAVKPTSREAIVWLKKLGVAKTVILSGDSQKNVDRVAAAVCADEAHGELLPADKVASVERLISAGGRVAFVGDGINDAPVLARADIGIAMGAMGTDAAIEAADVVLMDDDPLKLAKAIKISRRAMRIVRENIVIALSVKLLCLILGAFGIANMWLAVFADVGVMIIAVLNAVRALEKRA